MKLRYTFLFFTLFCLSATYGQWVRQYPVPKLENVTGLAMHGDQYGYAVGADDMILAYQQATNTWSPAGNFDEGWTLQAVDYLAGQAGQYAAAGGTGLIVSSDAGHSWMIIADAPTGIHTLKIIDVDHILVITPDGVHNWQNDTWTNLQLPVSSNVDGGFILDENHIWCFTNGASPTIYYTHNHGAEWNNTTDVPRPDIVRFYSQDYGVSLDGREVYQSHDGGATWIYIDNAIHNSVNDLDFGTDANVMIAATLNGVPTISIDSGKTWTQKPMTGLPNNRSYAVEALSNETFFVGNDLSGLAYSENNGTNWTEQYGPQRKVFQDGFFLNRNIGFIVGNQGAIMRTLNGGLQWEDLAFEATRTNWSIHGLSPEDLWMGSNQRIYHSADTGNTWQQFALFVASNINDIHAISASRLLACSSSGIIYRSDDTGASWDTVYQTNTQLKSIAHIGGDRYMATGFNGHVLRSDDNGETWNALTPPVPDLQYEQSYFLGTDGWLITSSFENMMWHTNNGGDSWNPINLPIERFWFGVHFMTKDTGVIVGNSASEGRAYITFNGGQNWQSGYITDIPFYGVTGTQHPNGAAWIFGIGSDIEILPYCDMIPVMSNLFGEIFPCENDTVQYHVTATNVDNYHWFFPAGWEVLSDTNNDTVSVRVGRNAGNISVSGSNSCGFSNPLIEGVGANLLPTMSVISGQQRPCEGTIQIYSVDAMDVDQYTWTLPDASWEIIGGNTSANLQVRAGDIGGVLSVSGTNECGETDTIRFNVLPRLRPRGFAVNGNPTPCINTLLEYEFNGQFADTVLWTFPADWTLIGVSGLNTIVVQIGLESGLITATGVNECGESAIPELNAVPQDAPDVVAELDIDSGLLSVTASGVSTYQWYFDNQIIPGANESEYLATEIGDYYCIVTFANTCIRTTNTVTVTIVAADDPNGDAAIRFFPNPVSGQLFISGLQTACAFDILHLQGAICLQGMTDGSGIALDRLTPGVYVIRLRLQDTTLTHRLMVQP